MAGDLRGEGQKRFWQQLRNGCHLFKTVSQQHASDERGFIDVRRGIWQDDGFEIPAIIKRPFADLRNAFRDRNTREKTTLIESPCFYF